MLLLLHLCFTLVTSGSSLLALREDVCYGNEYHLPTSFSPGLYNKTITYTPNNGLPKIVVNHGKSLDPRFKILPRSIEMNGVIAQDDVAVISSESMYLRAVRLRVQICHVPSKKRYGSFVNWEFPYKAEYLEFLKYNGSGLPVSVEARVIWNSSGPSYERGYISNNGFQMDRLTQQDSGFYHFRGPQHHLLNWMQIVVELKFKHFGNYNARPLPADNRFKITDFTFSIGDATTADAGTYEFYDKQGNLMQVSTVEIREVEKVWGSYIIMGAISVGLTLCSCCVKYCCCNESSSKTDETEDEEAAAPAVFEHNPTRSTQTGTPLLPREPRLIIPDPPSYSSDQGPADLPPSYSECVPQPSASPVPAYSSLPKDTPVAAAHISSPLGPPVSAAGVPGPTFSSSTNFDLIASGSEPTFELSGSTFASAPPLSSEGSTSAEYNSDKLNFL
uniref:Uncharacterized protein n=1 Tax=Knipowitschia caucasica TaxID=637954 RepID=A0AAV2MJJ3_KNICA